jgi:hypothetical protein
MSIEILETLILITTLGYALQTKNGQQTVRQMEENQPKIER